MRKLRVLRSWPAQVPAGGKNFVVDTLPKLVLDNYDYGPLADVDDDVVILEWDIAVSREDLHTFITAAQDDRSRVIVAPYRLYVTTVHGHALKRPVWCHRRRDGQHVETGEPTCGMFGFGLIYFPREIVRGFRAAWSGHFSDGAFGGWHAKHVTDRVPILWDVRPIHLHYDLAEFGVDTLPAHRPTVLTRLPDPDADTMAAERVADGMIAALLRERAGLVRQGKLDRVAAVNEALAARGYDDAGA